MSRPTRSATSRTPSPQPTRAMICWTLGITEHHNAVDNVLALINLALLTGHVGRYGSGINPLRGQNNVQGGGDMGALPDRLPGFQHVENDELRAKFDRMWGVTVPPHRGWTLSEMFDAMERERAHDRLLHRREPAPVRGRPDARPAPARGPGVPRRPGPVPDEDRRARRRRAAGERRVGRGGGHGHQLASGASSASARRSIRRATRATTCAIIFELAEPDGLRLGLVRGRGRLERGPIAIAGPRRHELRAGSRSSAGSSGRATTRRIPASCSSTAGCGRTRSRAIACRSSRRRARSAGRQADRRLPDPAHDRPPARLVQHRRPDGGLHLAAAARRVARHLAGGRRGLRPRGRRASSASSRGAGGSRSRSGSTRRCGPGSRS